MKNLVLAGLLLAGTLYVGSSNGQTGNAHPIRCNTTDYMNAKMAADPAYARQFEMDEQTLQRAIANLANNRSSSSNSIVTIPCVVHVVYRTVGQNISDAQVESQIDVLNEDFARLNADTNVTPAPVRAAASGSQFRFCLAQTDPNGNPTTGIERRQTTVNTFSTNDLVKAYSTGGMDAWDTDVYFNIWVCSLGGGILGYAEFPAASHTDTYGVVITYSAFGRVGLVAAPYDQGRTCTHEVGHAFRLNHIWGDDGGSCGGTDYVADTPNQAGETYGCRTFPHTDACTPSGNGVMFMNYMDYSDDDCLNMFTTGQVTRMTTAMNTFYSSLLVSTRCESANSIQDGPENFSFSVYPNPTNGVINLDMFLTRPIGDQAVVRVVDALGKIVYTQVLNQPSGQVHSLDLSSLPNGIYLMNVGNAEFSKTVRVSVSR